MLCSSLQGTWYGSNSLKVLQVIELMGGKTKRRRELKSEAVPTKFTHKPTPKVRSSSVARAAKRKRQEVKGHFMLLVVLLLFC